jgi:Transcriptional regulator, AbiEi antitoxin, Type IV TA system
MVFHSKWHFQRMLKPTQSMKEFEHRAADALRQLLAQVPAIELLGIEHEAYGSGRGADIVAHINAFGRRHVLVCEVKSTGQPRHVRTGLLQLRDYMAHHAQDGMPLFIAPYLSLDAQTLCREQGVGFLDFEGNARLIFDGVFIERQVASKPVAERRELKSLFKPKSAQVLRVMLRDPVHAWRVSDLAQAADVSLGHVSNVRSSLLDREWAQVSSDGLFLSEPDGLLDEWRDAYEPPAGKGLTFYTTLHGSALEDVMRRAVNPHGGSGLAVLASFSAAHWLAPYGRTSTQYFYADETGLERLKSALKLSAASKGENVKVTVLKDYGLFRDTVEPAPGAICTSPVQTYLDLSDAGERGREAADHLRREKLRWRK